MGALTKGLKRMIPNKGSFVTKFSDNLNSGVFLKKTKSNKKVKKNKRIAKKSDDNFSVSREDFETFGIGVRRLRELKKELDSLDTRGFSKEEQTIRNKLKNVSEIPTIEKGIRVLKLEIDKKYKPKRRKKSAVKKSIEDIQEDIGNIKEFEEKIETRAKKLEIDKKNKPKRRRRKKSAVRRSIENLQEDIEDIKEFEEKIETQAKIKSSIDPGVGILVDNHFDSLLDTLKLSLSNRIRKKEKEINFLLKRDLEKREKNFKQKYFDLLDEFNEKKKKLERDFNEGYERLDEKKNKLEKESHDKYEKALKTNLKKEVDEKFNEKVEQKLEKEKMKLESLEKQIPEKVNKEIAKKIIKIKTELRENYENKAHMKIKKYEEEMQKKLKQVIG
jgi:hypothetical protein